MDRNDGNTRVESPGMKVFMISLGCDKNLADSEEMLGILREAGFVLTDDLKEADACAVNTCGFIKDAKEESITTICDLLPYKTQGKLRYILVTGCLAERYFADFSTEFPEVDAILGTNAYDKIAEALLTLSRQEKREVYAFRRDFQTLCKTDAKRVLSSPVCYAYLKIAEGCNKHCTYCAIPSMRGGYRSVPMEKLVEEARCLASQGIKELILVAQETTIYGVDLYGEKRLAALLHALSEIDGILRLRVMYCYPEEIDDALIGEIRSNPKVCHYLDLPIQHASDRILKRMGRRCDQEMLRSLIAKLRKEIPDICLRTTMIVGFPGETQEDMRELIDFVDDMEFDRLGAFTYSPEEDTPAASYPDQIDEEEKEIRYADVMELQQAVSADISKRFIGNLMEVMVDGYLPEEDVYAGRSFRDAPDVDGLVFFTSDRNLYAGDMVSVRILDAKAYDLIGEML